jgi:PPOX class probable F420-dependent enzyme
VVGRDELLAGRFVAALATEQPDGSAHLTAVWYLWDGEAFLVPTSAASRKARNAAARPRASIMVDARRGIQRGLAATCSAEVLTGEEALRLNARIHVRYLTEEGHALPQLGRLIAESDDATLRLLPRRWHGWDMGEAVGGVHVDPRYVLPLDL